MKSSRSAVDRRPRLSLRKLRNLTGWCSRHPRWSVAAGLGLLSLVTLLVAVLTSRKDQPPSAAGNLPGTEIAGFVLDCDGDWMREQDPATILRIGDRVYGG